MSGPSPARVALAAIALTALAATPLPARTQTDGATHDRAGGCEDGRTLEHAFDSGALWSLCARLDEVHGLELRDVRYRAPGDTRRPVLRSLHLAQLLVHWHDEPLPERRLHGATATTRGLGGDATVALDAASCDGETRALDPAADGNVLCTRVRDGGILAKYAQRPALHGAHWELFTVARQGLLLWRTGVELTEDGQIVPAVALSGRIERTGEDARHATSLDGTLMPTRATLLATWRMHFALDTPATDRVEELDFPLESDGAQRRPMRVRPLDVELFRPVAPERFRFWRVLDPANGAGYTLDPLDSGRRWSARGADWTRFELAVTAARECERHAEVDESIGPGASVCGGGLDDFVDGESLEGADPVLWFSRTRLWSPRLEDLPFLSSVTLDTRIVPFDWTASSPFEVTE